MKRLEGRVAIVTGSAQGMGLAIAKALGNEGAVIIITDINEEQVSKTVSALKEDGYSADGYSMNVTAESQVKEVFTAVKEKYGKLDILVNNAGGALNTPYKLNEIEEKHWNLVLDVNLPFSVIASNLVSAVIGYHA